jgi:retron-type reverse transcriptase
VYRKTTREDQWALLLVLSGFFTGWKKMEIYQFLCRELDVTRDDIYKFSLSAPKKYKVYTIPKRSSGTRTIAHPSKSLKLVQRTLIKYIEQFLPVHHAAYAYKKGSNIRKNALNHKKAQYLLKMDFQDFFNSINPSVFFDVVLSLDIQLDKEEIELLTQLLFWCPSKKTGGKLILSVGAPSSPLLSNFVMFNFDTEMCKVCTELGVTYTRYADDITFSTNKKNVLFEVPAIVKENLRTTFRGRITINERKTIYSSKAHNRHVTGVTITNSGSLSIGRKRKRYISSLIHKYTLGLLSVEDIAHAQGLLAFAKSIEPDFEERMKKKYSIRSIEMLYKHQQVSK